MSCCIVDLGKVPHIGPAKTGVNSADGGEYRFELNFLNAKISRKGTIEAGAEIEIPGPFNEDATYTVNIFDPTGEAVSKDVSGDPCFDFFFRTFIAVDEDCYKNECDESNSSEPYPYN